MFYYKLNYYINVFLKFHKTSQIYLNIKEYLEQIFHCCKYYKIAHFVNIFMIYDFKLYSTKLLSTCFNIDLNLTCNKISSQISLVSLNEFSIKNVSLRCFCEIRNVVFCLNVYQMWFKLSKSKIKKTTKFSTCIYVHIFLLF